MNVLRQHIPGGVDIDSVEIQEILFESIDDVLSIDWVNRWSKKKNFYRFSVATNEHEYGTYLMAELEYGQKWYVLGRFKSMQGISLPEWENPNV